MTFKIAGNTIIYLSRCEFKLKIQTIELVLCTIYEQTGTQQLQVEMLTNKAVNWDWQNMLLLTE